MPLITSTTALNKLKWGNDRFNAGQTNGSNQPYIKRDIPGVNVDDPNPTLFNDGGDLPAKTGIDFLIRNGFRAPVDAIRDVSRLFQMFTDLRSPNGLLFTAAQNILSRTAVKTEASYGIGYGGVTPPNFITGKGGGALNEGIYTPLSTLAQAGIGFTGTHLNLMGLDPTSPMSGVIEGGLFPGAGLNTYFGTIRAKNSPATFSTKTETYIEKVPNLEASVNLNLPLILGSEGQGQGGLEPATTDVERERIVTNDQSDFDNRLTNLLNSKINIGTTDVNIISYTGGPGSILGIGSTNIRFADQRTGVNNPLFTADPEYFLGTSGKDHYNLNPQTKDYLSKLGASVYAQKTFRAEEDREEIINYSTNEIIENENTKQSTISNAELSNAGFFTGDPEVSPNNYGIFIRPNTPPTKVTKTGIFFVGASKQMEKSLIDGGNLTAAVSLFEGFNLSDDSALRLWSNNVYQNDLVSVGRNANGKQWAQNTWTFTQTQIEAQNFYNVNPSIQDFRKIIIDSNGITTSSVLSLAPNYVSKSANRRINRGDPGKSNTTSGLKDVFNYGLPATSTAALDKLTAMPMYDGQGPNSSYAINDFVKFRIAAINNQPDANGSAVYMHFRAFIDSFSDNYNATWDPVKYSGRGEDLYNYSGFGRNINMSFTCFAQSKAELIPMYKKLNYLASTLAPDYTNSGFMRGNLIRLTMGGYLYEQPGFISTLTYDVPQESPWEIAINAEGGGDGSVKELPHMIKVTLQFTPIHNFLPQKPNVANNPNERYIALANAFNSRGNYADEYAFQTADGDGDNSNTNDIAGE
tara:strand:+ start:1317 stop:3734 length:2418 start_codon:yes stop_codon:yes gene_type:complete